MHVKWTTSKNKMSIDFDKDTKQFIVKKALAAVISTHKEADGIDTLLTSVTNKCRETSGIFSEALVDQILCEFVQQSEMNITEEVCDDEIDKSPSPVPFSLKQHEQPLRVRRDVYLTCDADQPTIDEDIDATQRNWGPEMRDTPFKWFHFHEARYLGDPDCDEDMPDMDPPKQPKTSVGDEDAVSSDDSKSPSPISNKRSKAA